MSPPPQLLVANWNGICGHFGLEFTRWKMIEGWEKLNVWYSLMDLLSLSWGLLCFKIYIWFSSPDPTFSPRCELVFWCWDKAFELHYAHPGDGNTWYMCPPGSHAITWLLVGVEITLKTVLLWHSNCQSTNPGQLQGELDTFLIVSHVSNSNRKLPM